MERPVRGLFCAVPSCSQPAWGGLAFGRFLHLVFIHFRNRSSRVFHSCWYGAGELRCDLHSDLPCDGS